jgi:hypothetical protein
MSDERTLEEQCYGVCYAAKERIAELEAGNAAELRRLHSVNAALLWALQQIADETYDVWTNGAKAQRIAERAIKEVQP